MKRKLSVIRKLTACIVLLIMLIPASVMAANISATVSASPMSLYSKNAVGVNFYIGSLKKGTEITLTKVSGKWARISYEDGRMGYAQLSDIKVKNVSLKETNYKAKVTASSLSVYSVTHAYDSFKLGSLPKNTEVKVTAAGNDWAKITYDGKTGYVKLDYLKKTEAAQEQEQEKVDWTQYAAQVTSDKMKVYSTNNASDTYYIGYLSKGTKFTVLATSGDWARISYDGKIGFAKLSNFKKTSGTGTAATPKPEATPTTKTLMYTNREAKIYSSASDNNALCTVTSDFPVYVVGTSGNYYRIKRTDSDVYGYIKKAHVSDEKTNSLKLDEKYKKSYSSGNSTTTMPGSVKSDQNYYASYMGNTQKINYMIYYAQSKLGCDYNTSPNNKTSFKNPSFVRACFSFIDYSVSSSAYDIGHKGDAAYIKRGDLKRGDIICFDLDGGEEKSVDNVGIYLGNNYFIHASATADAVIVTKMNNYYNDAFCWGRRIIG